MIVSENGALARVRYQLGVSWVTYLKVYNDLSYCDIWFMTGGLFRPSVVREPWLLSSDTYLSC